MKAHDETFDEKAARMRGPARETTTSFIQHEVGEILHNQAVLADALCILLKYSKFGEGLMIGPDKVHRAKLYHRLTKITLKHQVDADAR